MKTEIKITTLKEIELPYYCTDNSCHVWKVFSEELCISVYSDSIFGSATIDIAHAGLPFSLGSYVTKCTKEVFEKMYDEALAKINEALEL